MPQHPLATVGVLCTVQSGNLMHGHCPVHMMLWRLEIFIIWLVYCLLTHFSDKLLYETIISPGVSDSIIKNI